MSNHKIKPKRTTTAGAEGVPTTAHLEAGEIAINLADKKLFVRDTSDNILELTTRTITSLDDATISSPTNGEVLTYSAGSGKWENNAPTSAVWSTTELTATAGQTVFTATYTVGKVDVYVNGIRLDDADYTATNGTSVTLGEAAEASDTVYIASFELTAGTLPSQTGHSGKFLTTNGTSSSWGTVDLSTKVDKVTGKGLSANDFTDADHSKLDGIEANATADQSDAEIKTAYENNADTNAFTDADHSKLDGIEANATADQTASEIKTAYESNADTNEFSDAEQTKLSGIEASANNYSHPASHAISEVTGLQTALDGKTTESYVDTQVAGIVDSAPATLDTLNELAAALGDDANFSTTVTNSIATKLPLAGGTLTGDLTVDGVTYGIYHSVKDNQYYHDPYTGVRNLSTFLKSQRADIIRYRPVSDVEYWNGSSWVDGSSQLANVEKLLDGRQDTSWHVPSTYYKFRFVVSASTGWSTMALIGTQTSWSGSTYPGFSLSVEQLQTDGTTWTEKVSSDFTSANGNNNWGLNFQASDSLHTGRQTTRITVDFYGWTPSNSSYTYIPLQNIFITSNYAGTENTDYTNLLDYDRNATFSGNISVSGTVDGRNIASDGSKLDGIADSANNYIHPSNHSISEVTGLQTALDAKTTESYVDTEITNLIGGAPGALDTLNELAAAINDDSSYASTVTSALGGKVATSSAQALSSAANAMTISGTTITLARGDGTTDTVSIPAGYTDSDVDSHLSGGSGITYSSGAISVTAGSIGASHLAANSVDSSELVDNSVDASHLNVSGNGTTSQFLRADGDGSFTWATPTDTNTTYSVGDGGLTQKNFTTTLKNKLDGIAASANNYSYPYSVDQSTATTSNVTFNNVTVSGTLTESSAAVYKENITPLDGQLANIMQLNPVEYDKKASGVHEYGLIADEVQKVYPDFVGMKDGQADSLNYSRMVSVLVKAVQELTEKVEKLSK